MSLTTLALAIGSVSVVASDIQTIQSAVTAFQTIGTLRRETPINGDAIAVAYEGDLQTLTQEIDTTNSLKLDSDILAAIEEIKNNNEPSLAAQVIDKTLQRVFYQSFFNRIAAIRDEFESATSATLIQILEETEAVFQAVSATAARSNEVLSADRQFIEEGSNPGLDVQITESLARIRTALNKNNPDEDFATFFVERYVTRMSLARAYYIGVLREVRGVIENRNSDLNTARIQLKEGEVFYRIIESLVARDNPTGNALIKTQLAGNAADVVADEIVSELNKGFIGRVKGEMDGQANSIGVDRVHAMAEAAGAMAFAKILLPDLELRLGTEARVNLEAALSDLQTASSDNSIPNSAIARDAISAILNSYEAELNLVKYSATTETALIDNAVASFKTIGELRAETTINGTAIEAAYAGELRQLTQLVDQTYGTSINADVSAAIESVKAGNEIPFSLQIIDKSLQRVFAIVVYDRTTFVTESRLVDDALVLEWDRANSAYSAIAGTAGRVNKVLTEDKQTLQDGSNPDLDDQITLAFVQGREALGKTNPDEVINLRIARENIIIPLVRTYLIGVLREVEGIIASRNTDAIEAREKQIEGEFFYRIVESFIASDNPTGSNLIKTQLTGDLANVDANQIVIEISKGIIGQVNRNIRLIEFAFHLDRFVPPVAAERVSLYINIFLPDLELRLGSLERVKVQNALQDLREAIETQDVSKALTAGSTLTGIIAAYENELI
ncbi:hypothetical protein [uncultured Nitrosomonas sp.]|uniref:hypothetical protein n=1 Tax=uncultured Nitrosomonas sp. TaxID=156424 RepID=UPI0025EE2F4D|nr:hypothetical protein [uncultured Nitrosomonas sp.]